MPLITFAVLADAGAGGPPAAAGRGRRGGQSGGGERTGGRTSSRGWCRSFPPIRSPRPRAATWCRWSCSRCCWRVAIARSPTASRETLLGFFRALADAMLVLVRWVVAAAPIGIFGLMLPLAAHGGAGGGRRGRLLHRGLLGRLHRRRCCSSIPWWPSLGRIPLATFARAALPAAADRLQLELVDRVAAGAGRGGRGARACRRR